MATPSCKQEITQISHMYDGTSDEEEEDDEEEEEFKLQQQQEEDIDQSLSCCWRIPLGLNGGEPITSNQKQRRSRGSSVWSFSLGGIVFNSRPNRLVVQEWNRIFFFICIISLFVDPLFFYVLAMSEVYLCLFIDGWFAITVTVLRTMIDALYVWNMWIQFKVGSQYSYNEAIRGSRNWAAGLRYLKDTQGFLLDLFLILPLHQIVLWVAIPSLLRKGLTDQVMKVWLSVFVLQYLGKIYQCACLLRRLRRFSVYIFGSAIWWGVALNVIAYFIASHAAGACWYLLGIQRVTNCLREQCNQMQGCNPKVLASYQQPFYYGTTSIFIKDRDRLLWASSTSARSNCFDTYDNYEYGAYQWVIFLVANNSRLEKILMPMFWGLMTMSTFGNLESTTDWVESLFIIIVLTTGLLMVTMLIGNIKVFMHSATSKKQAMQLRMRNIEWWMKIRMLPPALKQRVRNYEWQRWAATRGVDECEMIYNLPEGLRRDIKYHLCLDLVKQVPLFQHMDDLVLENICDRVKSLIFTEGETIAREGDPIQRMLFIVSGHLQSIQTLRDGVKSSCTLGPGNFTGDELLSWCLKRPFNERLPPSSSTLITLESTEAFGLEAQDVKYVTQHFRYTFTNEKVKRSAKYYSPGWRTWAAVAIQLAWRRHKQCLDPSSLSLIRPRRPLSRTPSSVGEDRLRFFTAILTSPKPPEDDFIDF